MYLKQLKYLEVVFLSQLFFPSVLYVTYITILYVYVCLCSPDSDPSEKRGEVGICVV